MRLVRFAATFDVDIDTLIHHIIDRCCHHQHMESVSFKPTKHSFLQLHVIYIPPLTHPMMNTVSGGGGGGSGGGGGGGGGRRHRRHGGGCRGGRGELFLLS